MNDARTSDLQEFQRLLDATPLVKSEPGDYAELVDENDEHGLVNVCRKGGHVFMQMPRDVWDDLQKVAGR